MYDIHSHLRKKIREAKLVVLRKIKERNGNEKKENDEIDREKNNFYSV